MEQWKGEISPRRAIIHVLINTSATADGTEYNTGGKITVDGLTVSIPKNLQFQFPAAWVPFKDIAAGGYTGNEVSVNPLYPFRQCYS